DGAPERLRKGPRRPDLERRGRTRPPGWWRMPHGLSVHAAHLGTRPLWQGAHRGRVAAGQLVVQLGQPRQGQPRWVAQLYLQAGWERGVNVAEHRGLVRDVDVAELEKHGVDSIARGAAHQTEGPHQTSPPSRASISSMTRSPPRDCNTTWAARPATGWASATAQPRPTNANTGASSGPSPTNSTRLASTLYSRQTRRMASSLSAMPIQRPSSPSCATRSAAVAV